MKKRDFYSYYSIGRKKLDHTRPQLWIRYYELEDTEREFILYPDNTTEFYSYEFKWKSFGEASLLNRHYLENYGCFIGYL